LVTLTLTIESIEPSNYNTWTATRLIHVDVYPVQDPISCQVAQQVMATEQVVVLPDITCEDIDLADEPGFPSNARYYTRVELEGSFGLRPSLLLLGPLLTVGSVHFAQFSAWT